MNGLYPAVIPHQQFIHERLDIFYIGNCRSRTLGPTLEHPREYFGPIRNGSARYGHVVLIRLVYSGVWNLYEPVPYAMRHRKFRGHPDGNIVLILLQTGLQKDDRFGTKKVRMIQDKYPCAVTVLSYQNVATLTKTRKNGPQILFILHRHSRNIKSDMKE